jgi:magnesium transporter
VIQLPKELGARYRSMARDVVALSDHASFLANKSSFMLQATLGLISIEQNNIIKIFSVAATMLLPPTLIASIYGMNFTSCRDSTTTMATSGTVSCSSRRVPYFYFRRRGWI